MKVLLDPEHFVPACEKLRADGQRVGLVPTMGALHAGHLALVDEARNRGATKVVVTVFVNPLQFGPNEDYGRYPRTLEADVNACRERGVDLVFAPPADRMYPPGFQTHVEVTGLTERLEGAFRPGHFRGVTTVVTKLFAMTGQCVAVFGRKDYQQWKVIERMAKDLSLPIEVVGHPTVREADGLALSSRNRYLSAEQRLRALSIVDGLRAASAAYAAGERSGPVLAAMARERISASFDRIDYVEAVDPETLVSIGEDDTSGKVLILVAAHLGKTRLIDNMVM